LLSTNLYRLERFYQYYNYERYFTEHTGLRPIDVLNGKIPDKHMYKELKEQVRKERIKTNQSFNACMNHSA